MKERRMANSFYSTTPKDHAALLSYLKDNLFDDASFADA
jgi:hypothetical protein